LLQVGELPHVPALLRGMHLVLQRCQTGLNAAALDRQKTIIDVLLQGLSGHRLQHQTGH
jgi:hypothetical protein